MITRDLTAPWGELSLSQLLPCLHHEPAADANSTWQGQENMVALVRYQAQRGEDTHPFLHPPVLSTLCSSCKGSQHAHGQSSATTAGVEASCPPLVPFLFFTDPGRPTCSASALVVAAVQKGDAAGWAGFQPIGAVHKTESVGQEGRGSPTVQDVQCTQPCRHQRPGKLQIWPGHRTLPEAFMPLIPYM